MNKYFERQYEEVNNEFFGFGGNDLPFGGDDLPANGDEFNAYGMDQWGFAADAAPVQSPASAPTSQPYIVSIENTTTATVSNVTILDSAQRQNNFAVSGVSITYGLSSITYQQFLSSISAGRSFRVGLMRLVGSASSSSNAEAQVLTTVTITTSDLNGNQIVKPIIPQKDSYQYQNAQADIFYPFMVDELTKIVFASILGSTTLKVYFYPSAKTNPFKQLANRGNVSVYGNPQINKMISK